MAGTGFSDPVTVASFVVAGVTALLAGITLIQATLSRRTLGLSLRPFLVEAQVRPDVTDDLLFGAPGRISAKAERRPLWYQYEDGQPLYISVAFENIGQRAATIQGARTVPKLLGDHYVTPKFVAPGAVARVNISVHNLLDNDERFTGPWWAMEGLAVEIDYADTDGGHRMTSTARVAQAATQGPWVREVLVTQHRQLRRPRLLARGEGTY